MKKVGLFAWDAQGKATAALRSSVLSSLKKLTVKEYIEKSTDISAMVIAVAAVKDEEFGAVYAQLVQNATDADREELKEKIDRALSNIFSFEHLVVGNDIFNYAAIGVTLSQLCKNK
ncbi:MAG: hypothetical protein E6Q33_01455 [Neisseriales bacterium]|nr:MAG: hypothetical protein E6Q33_01455 [Neisseriales bacterium]